MDGTNFYEQDDTLCPHKKIEVEALQNHLSSVMKEIIILMNEYRKTTVEINSMLEEYGNEIAQIPEPAITLQDMLSKVSAPPAHENH